MTDARDSTIGSSKKIFKSRMSFHEDDYVVPLAELSPSVGRIRSKDLRPMITEYGVEFFGKVDEDGKKMCCGNVWTYRHTDLRLASGREIDIHLKEMSRTEEAIRKEREREKKIKDEEKRREEQKQQLESAIASMTYTELWQSRVFYGRLVDLHDFRIKEILEQKK